MAKEDPDDLEPPISIDPYQTLNLADTATAAEIRTAYKKLALHLHPDKAAPADRDKAHKAFQDLAFAYAILSDERRRKRYDTTGSTAETLDLDDDDFNWSDFFRAQYSELVTTERITDFQKTYKGSEEERKDVLAAYRKGQGSLDRVFENVVLSNPLDDEDRFCSYIDEAIRKGEVDALKLYTQESEKAKQRRHKKARKETEEAEAHAEELGIRQGRTKNGGKKGPGKSDGMEGPALMIQQRKEQRRDDFLDGLLDKHGGKDKKKKKGKRGTSPADEPSEEAFAEMGQRKKRKVTDRAGNLAGEQGKGPNASKKRSTGRKEA